MGFLIGQTSAAIEINSSAAAQFDVPQLVRPDFPVVAGNARYNAFVIVAPASAYILLSALDPEVCRYAIDAPATDASLLYDTFVSHPVALPVDARYISIFNSSSGASFFAVAFGIVK